MQSYRHSHYGKDRVGVTLDEEWFTTVGAAGSTLRAGLWYEDSRRDLGRDWHQILDPTLNFNWNEQAYWHQYEWDFPQHVGKWYVEETLYAGPFALSGGLKGTDALYRPRVLGQWFDGIRIYAAASSPPRSRRTRAGLR